MSAGFSGSYELHPRGDVSRVVDVARSVPGRLRISVADLAIAFFLERVDVLMESVQDGDGFSICRRKHIVLEFRGTVLRSNFCLKGCYSLSSPTAVLKPKSVNPMVVMVRASA